jgi:hypothetical protein
LKHTAFKAGIFGHVRQSGPNKKKVAGFGKIKSGLEVSPVFLTCG